MTFRDRLRPLCSRCRLRDVPSKRASDEYPPELAASAKRGDRARCELRGLLPAIGCIGRGWREVVLRRSDEFQLHQFVPLNRVIQVMALGDLRPVALRARMSNPYMASDVKRAYADCPVILLAFLTRLGESRGDGDPLRRVNALR